MAKRERTRVRRAREHLALEQRGKPMRDLGTSFERRDILLRERFAEDARGAQNATCVRVERLKTSLRHEHYRLWEIFAILRHGSNQLFQVKCVSRGEIDHALN